MQNTPEWRYNPDEDIIDRMRHRRQKSIVNYIIVAANILIFLIVEMTGGSENAEHMIRCGASYTPYVQAGGILPAVYEHVSSFRIEAFAE